MNWDNNRWMRRVRHWPEHMQILAAQLGELAKRVRESVGELVGESVGTAVRDLLQRAWRQQAAAQAGPNVEPSRNYREEWHRRDENDPWADHEDDRGWSAESSAATDLVAPTSAPPVPRTALLALAMQAAGWWLRQRGSWFAALGLGCIVGGLAFLGGPIAAAGLNLLESAGDVYSLNQLLTAGPDRLLKG